MIDYVLEICKDMKLETIYAIMLQDNFQAISLMKKMGFTVKFSDDGTAVATLDLREEEIRPCVETDVPRESQVKTEELQTEQKEPGEAGIVQGQPA
jgi:hypothetical protein